MGQNKGGYRLCGLISEAEQQMVPRGTWCGLCSSRRISKLLFGEPAHLVSNCSLASEVGMDSTGQ